jgi:hypothetical protein
MGDFWKKEHYKVTYNSVVKLGGSTHHYAKGNGSQTSLFMELKVKLWFMKVYNIVGCNKN